MEAALARGMRPVFTAVQRRFGLRGWGWGGFFGDGGLWGRRRGCNVLMEDANRLSFRQACEASRRPETTRIRRLLS